ncbi:MAG: hypothetical protein ABJB40_13850 [Acidobacteriota bacterium]
MPLLEMRNLISKILLGCLAFSITFAVGTIAWKRQPLSLCTITEYKTRFQPFKGDNHVNLKGYLYGGSELSFGDTRLLGCEESAADIALTDESSLSPESQNLIRNLRSNTYISEVKGSDQDNRYAREEVQIVGVLSEREQYCFTSRYVISAVEITPIGSLEVIDSSELAAELTQSR